MNKMDVVKPQLVWLGTRCYRKYATNDDLTKKNKQTEELDETIAVCQDEPCDVDFGIEKLPNGLFRTNMAIAKGYFGCIIGVGGAIRKRLEMETKARINVPRFGEEGDISLIGASKNIIASARTRIELIVDAARQRQPFTHFVSIPMIELKSKFLEFCDDVLRECHGDRGLDKSLFQKPEKLHLTIGTMPLLDKRERDVAIKLLEDCTDLIQYVLKKEPLVIHIQGLEYMNDDPAEVDILYAKIKSNECGKRLQLLADRLVDRFVTEGIMQKQYGNIKLHMTVLNTLFRKDDSGEMGNTEPIKNLRGTLRESFDATNVLKIFDNYDFGEVRVNNIHISQRHSNSKSGYYASLSILPLC